MGRQLEKLEQIWLVFLISLRVSDNSFTHIPVSSDTEREIWHALLEPGLMDQKLPFQILVWITDRWALSKETADPQPRMALSKPSSVCRLYVGQQRHLVILWFKYTLFSWELSNLIKL